MVYCSYRERERLSRRVTGSDGLVKPVIQELPFRWLASLWIKLERGKIMLTLYTGGKEVKESVAP